MLALAGNRSSLGAALPSALSRPSYTYVTLTLTRAARPSCEVSRSSPVVLVFLLQAETCAQPTRLEFSMWYKGCAKQYFAVLFCRVRLGSHRLSPLGISANMLFDWDGSGRKGQSVFAGNDVGRTVADGYAPMGSMPNCVKFAAKAGDCCIFDLATCALPLFAVPLRPTLRCSLCLFLCASGLDVSLCA